jgi:DNA-directed RNA polymerase specialized sigma24 family protein
MAKHKEGIMPASDVHSLSAYSNNSEPGETLEQLDAYIIALARKKIPHNVVHPDVLDLEIDELAQNARIKFWLTSQKQQITNPRAYIRCIVHSESVNMIRQHRPILALPTDEDNELYQGDLLVTTSEGMQDPSDEFEREELVADYIAETVDAILTLPPCQQRAMICSLKDHLDDVLPLVIAFRNHRMDIETVNWPESKSEEQKSKASLSAARKKLLFLKRKYQTEHGLLERAAS